MLPHLVLVGARPEIVGKMLGVPVVLSLISRTGTDDIVHGDQATVVEVNPAMGRHAVLGDDRAGCRRGHGQGVRDGPVLRRAAGARRFRGRTGYVLAAAADPGTAHAIVANAARRVTMRQFR